MLRRWILMDKASDDGSPSGYGDKESGTTETTETPEKAGGNNQNSETNPSEKSGEGDEAGKTSDKPEQTETTDKDLTGYGDKGGTKDKGDVKDEKPLELDLKGFKEEEVQHIREFAKANGLTKEQAQAMVDNQRADQDDLAKLREDRKAEEAKIYAKWEQELRDDPDFGGANYGHSVGAVNKFISEHLPSFGKALTAAGKRLPPIAMKEILKVSEKMYGESTFVEGSKTSTEKERNPWDFYSNNG